MAAPDATGGPVPRLRGDLLVESVDDEVLIYDPGSGAVHHLNETAAAVLELCTGDLTVAEITAHLSGRYQVDSRHRMHRSVSDLVARMGQLGLVHTGDHR